MKKKIISGIVLGLILISTRIVNAEQSIVSDFTTSNALNKQILLDQKIEVPAKLFYCKNSSGTFELCDFDIVKPLITKDIILNKIKKSFQTKYKRALYSNKPDFDEANYSVKEIGDLSLTLNRDGSLGNEITIPEEIVILSILSNNYSYNLDVKKSEFINGPEMVIENREVLKKINSVIKDVYAENNYDVLNAARHNQNYQGYLDQRTENFKKFKNDISNYENSDSIFKFVDDFINENKKSVDQFTKEFDNVANTVKNKEAKLIIKQQSDFKKSQVKAKKDLNVLKIRVKKDYDKLLKITNKKTKIPTKYLSMNFMGVKLVYFVDTLLGTNKFEQVSSGFIIHQSITDVMTKKHSSFKYLFQPGFGGNSQALSLQRAMYNNNELNQIDMTMMISSIIVNVNKKHPVTW